MINVTSTPIVQFTECFTDGTASSTYADPCHYTALSFGHKYKDSYTQQLLAQCSALTGTDTTVK